MTTIETWQLIAAAFAIAISVGGPLIGWAMRLSNTLAKELARHETELAHIKEMVETENRHVREKLDEHNHRIVKRETEIEKLCGEVTDVHREISDMRQDISNQISQLRIEVVNRFNDATKG